LNRLIIHLSLILMLGFSTVFAQKVRIDGRIVNVNDDGISMAHVKSVANGTQTVSDSKGYFSIEVPSSDSCMLVVSHLGYKSQMAWFESGSTDVLIVLEYASVSLNSVTITKDKEKDERTNNAANRLIIGGDFLIDQMGGSLSASLQKIPGVQSANIGSSTARPLIRGNGGYRIVVAKNGIKQEEHYWNEHQGLGIDQYAVEQIELIKGPASLLYGSDAISGVVNLINTNIPKYQGVSGLIALNGSSNNQKIGGNLKFHVRKNNTFLKIHASRHHFADFIVPADSFEYKPQHYAPLSKSLSNTAGKETGVNIISGIVGKRTSNFLVFNFYESHNGFFAYASGQELVNADTSLHNVSRRDVLYPSLKMHNYDVQYISNFLIDRDKMSLKLAYQHNTSSEFEHIEDITGYRMDDVEKYSKTNLDLQFVLSTFNGHLLYTVNDTGRYRIGVGMCGLFQQNSKDGFSHLLPEYRKSSVGMLTTHHYKINQQWNVQGGARLDFHKLDIAETINPNPFLGDAVFNNKMESNYIGVSYGLGVVYLDEKGYLAKLHFGKSYRIPSAYELSSYGIHRHNLRFEKGNPSLQPEEAYQLDLVFEREKKSLFVSVSPFLCYYTNYIYLSPTPDFALGTFTGQVYEYVQNTSLQYGAEVFMSYDLPFNMKLNTAVEYVYAMNYDTRGALPFIPPLSIIPQIVYENTKSNLRISLESVSVFKQNLTAVNEHSTDGYMIFNVGIHKQFQIGKLQTDFSLGVQNIANKAYFNHLSYYRRLHIPEPGRNIFVSIKMPFHNQTSINN
jgi:iron complex outermembrane recepter protein